MYRNVHPGYHVLIVVSFGNCINDYALLIVYVPWSELKAETFASALL